MDFEYANKRIKHGTAVPYQLIKDPSPQEVARNVQLVRDAKDVPVALAAISAEVDCLVSEDKDLTEKNESTVTLHHQLQVFISGTFLREVMVWTSEQLEVVRQRTWQDLLAPA